MRSRTGFWTTLFGAVLVAASVQAQHLRIGAAAEITSADPQFQSMSPNNSLWRDIYMPLVGLDDHGNIIPAVAASWQQIDPLIWEFHIAPSLVFSDDTPVTADDVIFSLKRPPTVPNSPSSYAVYVRSIAAMDAPDPRTVRIHTKMPDPLLLQNLSAVAIMARHAAEGRTSADFANGAGIGSGPFRFVEWIPGSRVTLARNDRFSGPKPYWAQVTIRPITGNGARTAALLSGDVDMIEQVPTTDLSRIRGDSRFTIVSGVSTRVIYLQPDTARDVSPEVRGSDGEKLQRNPLRDLRVRQAISKALNRQILVERIMDGQAVAAGQFLPDGFFGTSPNLHPESYDPQGARALLAAAGWPQGFEVTLAGSNNRYPNDNSVVQAVAQMLTRIGIKTTVDAQPFATLIPRLSHQEGSLALVGLSTAFGDAGRQVASIAETFDPALGTGNFNFLRYSNPKLDAVMRQARTTMDIEQRRQLTAKASEIAIGDLAVIPLYFQKASWALRDGLTMSPNPAEYTLAYTVKSK